MKMIGKLCAPIMIVELLVVVSILENARLAVQSRSIFPLPAHANKLFIGNLIAALIASGCAYSTTIQWADCIKLFISHEYSLLADLPVDDDIDAFESC